MLLWKNTLCVGVRQPDKFFFTVINLISKVLYMMIYQNIYVEFIELKVPTTGARTGGSVHRVTG